MDMHEDSDQTPASNSHCISNEIAAIYTSTFQYVGMEFIDALMREITVQAQVDSALFLQLLSPEEYKEIAKIYTKDNKSRFHVVSCAASTTSSPEIQHSSCSSGDDPSPSSNVDLTSDGLQDQFLLIRSCFSNQASMKSRLTNAIIPLSTLSASSPYIKTLLHSEKIASITHNKDKEEVERGIYPDYEHFVGYRLEAAQKKDDAIRGLLCVTDHATMDNRKLSIISNMLGTVHTRCINELNQLQSREQLISARDLAVLDAENKLKFLADMSHEIRTPMNAVIALTDLLLQERSSLNIEQIEHLEVIQTSGSHLLTIINDILDISKLNHDPKFKLESRRFSLRKCLKDTLNMARHQASMSQQNKVVYVLECPPDKDDNMPLPQLIAQLENKGVLLRPLLHKKGKTVLPIIWKIDPDVPDHLLGDTMRLTQIMLNLCSNAVKFTKQGGIHIRIKRSTPTPFRTTSSSQAATRHNERRMTFKERYDAKIETMWTQALQDRRDRNSNAYNPAMSPTSSSTNTSGGLVTGSSALDDPDMDYFSEKSILEISVTDTGIGIPADRLPKLFKSFSQIDISTARRYGGTGLGLAISSTLVNRMGGCVWVESEEGVGSRFALTLPMTVAPRGRNYSSDSTPLGFAGSPSSPGSTVSDSSSSVHSALGGSNTGNDIISPMSSMYTFTTPAVNNTPNNPGYFPLTTMHTSNMTVTPQPQPQQQQQQQPQMHRPALPRTTHQQLYPSDTLNIRTEPQLIPQIIQSNTGSNESFSPMAEDTHALNAPARTMETRNAEDVKRVIANTDSSNNTIHNSLSANNASANQGRKSYNDLLSPASRSTRVGITKQHYHNRKPQTKEENLAKLHPLRILLAEDNILNQKIAISILKRLGYVDVAIANNGSEVLTLMKTSVFDVIFMDLYMPEMDGLEVTREIIKERTRQKQADMAPSNDTAQTSESSASDLLNTVDVYIIALTASASREDRQICIDAGMNDFISKPFTMTEMKSALKTCANKRKKRRKLAQQKQMEEVFTDTVAATAGIHPTASRSTEMIHATTDDPMLDVQTAAPSSSTPST
ncbi:uncharacterized protein ATC70_003297 [Mucor velutinosus]|uniref:Uncharacterized protein n=1 Tax=Mucor velutinosus TaxID=708070 RepID=A0AAN7D9U7_9FUNG|nr:hypothetical protein ATC70_003297 [Mucor velutinosus]